MSQEPKYVIPPLTIVREIERIMVAEGRLRYDFGRALSVDSEVKDGDVIIRFEIQNHSGRMKFKIADLTLGLDYLSVTVIRPKMIALGMID